MSNKHKNISIHNPNFESDLKIQFISDTVSAGFPSPANDFMEETIDLNKELCNNPLATFYIKVKGDSMINAGINNNDVLVVDRSIEPAHNKIAVCFIDGSFTVKRIVFENNTLQLQPENINYEPIIITQENQLIIWGIVTYTIKKM
jgi:DNA polymerase V